MAGYSLTPPPQDASGWTIKPAPDRSVFVANAGSDSNNGLTSGTPKQTLAAAYALLRDGHGDQLFLKCGDTWAEDFPHWIVSGTPRTAPIVVTSYGSGAQPIIQGSGVTGNNVIQVQGGGGSPSTISAVWFIGINFYCAKRDPANGSYDATLSNVSVIQWLLRGSDLMFEDCRFQFWSNGLDIDLSGAGGPFSDLRIRRCQILDNYSETTATHSQGAYLDTITDLLIEGNIFDHNGWNATVAGATPTVFNHNCYIHTATNPTFTNNVTSRASSYGLTMSITVLSPLVTDNLFLEDGNGFVFGGPVSGAVVTNNVFTEIGRTISAVLNNAGFVLGPASNNVNFTGNFFINNTGATNNSAITLQSGAQTGVSIINNTLWGWPATPLIANSATSGSPVTAPNNISATAWPRNIPTYDTSLGGPGTSLDFITRARANTHATYTTTLTAAQAVNYVVNSLSASWTVNKFGLVDATMDGISRLHGGWALIGNASTYGTTAQNAGTVQVGALITPSISGSTVTHVHQNATGVYVYTQTAPDTMRWDWTVTNTTASSQLAILGWAGLNAIFSVVPVSTLNNQPEGWFPTNGGLDSLHPSLFYQLGFWTMRQVSGPNAWGLGLGTLTEARSGFLDHHALDYLTNPVRAIRYVAETGDGSRPIMNLGPGQSVSGSAYFRVSGSTNTKYLATPYQTWFQSRFNFATPDPSVAFNRDDRAIVSSGAASSASDRSISNPDAYLHAHRYDLAGDPGVSEILARLTPGLGSAHTQGMIIWNLTGFPTTIPELIWPYFDQIPTDTATQLPTLTGGFTTASLLVGCSTRPMKVSNGSGGTQDIDPTNATQVSDMQGRFTWGATNALVLFYMDETCQKPWHMPLLKQYRATMGATPRSYTEYVTDISAAYSGNYTQINYVQGQHTMTFLYAYTLQMIQWLVPGMATVGQVRSTATNPATTLEYMGQHRITPIEEDWGFDIASLSAFYTRFIDPATNLWRAIPAGNPLDASVASSADKRKAMAGYGAPGQRPHYPTGANDKVGRRMFASYYPFSPPPPPGKGFTPYPP